MKLTKQPDNLEFKWKDVTFYIKALATAGDQFELDVLYEVYQKGEVRIPVRSMYKTIIQQFVVGWKGVTDDAGNEIPFSLENLMALPIDKKDDIVILLGGFVWQNTGIGSSGEKKTTS